MFSPFSTIFSKGYLLIDRIIDWVVFKLFSTLFQIYFDCQLHLTILSWNSLYQYSTQHSFQTTGCFPHNYCQTMESGERGMNPVEMNIINPRKNISRAQGSVTFLGFFKSGLCGKQLKAFFSRLLNYWIVW